MNQLRFELLVSWSDDCREGSVQIGCDQPQAPYVAIMLAAEHLMTMAALESGQPFDKALKSLVKGARSNRVKMSHGALCQ